jgi:hypothetical protein
VEINSYRRGLVVTGVLVCALLVLCGFSWQLWRPPAPPDAGDAPRLLDESLHRRLRQSLVRIDPEGGDGGGSGTLLDLGARLVATTEPAVGDRSEVRVVFPPDPATPDAAEQPAIAARVIYRDVCRRVVLLRLERVPSWALPMPLGGERAAFEPGRLLVSVRSPDGAGQAPAEKSSWSDTQAEIAQIYQPPHY